MRFYKIKQFKKKNSLKNPFNPYLRQFWSGLDIHHSLNSLLLIFPLFFARCLLKITHVNRLTVALISFFFFTLLTYIIFSAYLLPYFFYTCEHKYTKVHTHVFMNTDHILIQREGGKIKKSKKDSLLRSTWLLTNKVLQRKQKKINLLFFQTSEWVWWWWMCVGK